MSETQDQSDQIDPQPADIPQLDDIPDSLSEIPGIFKFEKDDTGYKAIIYSILYENTYANNPPLLAGEIRRFLAIELEVETEEEIPQIKQVINLLSNMDKELIEKAGITVVHKQPRKTPHGSTKQYTLRKIGDNSSNTETKPKNTETEETKRKTVQYMESLEHCLPRQLYKIATFIAKNPDTTQQKIETATGIEIGLGKQIDKLRDAGMSEDLIFQFEIEITRVKPVQFERKRGCRYRIVVPALTKTTAVPNQTPATAQTETTTPRPETPPNIIPELLNTVIQTSITLRQKLREVLHWTNIEGIEAAIKTLEIMEKREKIPPTLIGTTQIIREKLGRIVRIHRHSNADIINTEVVTALR